MIPTLADSVEAVPHSRIRELAEIAMGMDDVLKLYFGESNQPTPEFIKRAAIEAMNGGYTFYTENAGLPSLRRAIAEHYRKMHAVPLDPATEIVVTASGVQALNVGIRCVLDPGDEALVLTPAWPNGAAIVAMDNAVPIEIPHPLCGDRYAIDFDALERAVTPRTRLLVYTSPSNPLGWVATVEEQQRLLDFCRRHNLWMLADEVYDRLYYAGARLGEPVPSILRLATRDDALMVVHSVSKTYCMTGWRVGWLIARRDLVKRATQLNEFIISCAPGFAQKAAEIALGEGEAEIVTMLARLKANRDFCIEALSRMPRVTIPKPDGAFYLFPKIEGLTDSFDFCRRLLEKERVGLAPGVAFGAGGEGSIRICYAADQTVLEPAMQRLEKILMLRDPSLIPLSHQHHNGLALCVLTERSLAQDSTSDNVAKLARKAIDRYEVELTNHFEIEEQILFPASDSPLIAGLIADHRALTAMIDRLRAEPSSALLLEFTALLRTHIRREESELFEDIQRSLPRETLDVLGKEIDDKVVRICL